MSETVNIKNIGLRGVTVADTKISFIDGEKGVLIYRGYRIEQLAKESSFLEVAFLILYGRLPNSTELQIFETRVKTEREVPGFVIEALKQCPKDSAPMDVLQSIVPLLGMADPDLNSETRKGNVNMAIRLIARIPIIVAAWHRIREGKRLLPANENLSLAENFFWQLKGEKPDPEMAKDLDTCLILHADHTFNASTFACREVVSTRAHMYAGVTAGIGALSGSLHGGANQQVMKMLFELENEKDIPGWIKKQLDGGGKIMGMGHAVYKTIDPRAKYLKEMGKRLGEKTGKIIWHDLSMKIEKYGVEEFKKRSKDNIQPNVDFFSAPVYHIMGIPLDLMTPIFAMSRVSGWCGHIIEETFAEAQGKPALYRPKAEYIGNYCGLTGCEYEDLDAR